MRVTYLCLQPRSGSGASDTHVDGIVGALRRQGIKVDLLELRTASSSLVVRLLSGLWLQVRHLHRLRRSAAVHVRMHPTAVILPWLVGTTPLLVEVNGVPEDYVVAHPALRPFRPVLRAAIAHLLRRADHVVVVTEGLGLRVREWAPQAEVTVVPNAADPDIFRPGLQRPDDVPAGPYAIFFGALAPWQGLDLVLEAVGHPDWPGDLHLVVVGDGPLRDEVVRTAELRPDRVHPLGRRPAETIPAYVANAEVSFVTKRYHDRVAGQSPLKLYESLVAGTPVIATPSHGCTDVEGPSRAVFIAEPNVVGLHAAVERCRVAIAAGDPQLAAAIAHARAHQTWERRGAQLAEVLAAFDVR